MQESHCKSLTAADIRHGRFWSCMGGVWHPEFYACDKLIIDYEVSKIFIR